MAVNELHEQYIKSQFIWKFKDFFAFAKNQSATPFIDSPEFSFAGASWQLHMVKRANKNPFDVFIALVDGEEEYALFCQFGVKRGDDHVMQLEETNFLFANDDKHRKTKVKGLRCSARIGYLIVHQLEQQRQELVPSDGLTIVITLTRDTEDCSQISKKTANKQLIGK